MCGIFFVKTLKNNEIITKEKVDIVLQIHNDRGPDEKSKIIFKDWMMIHNRLAITAPNKGHQPISNNAKTAYMVFNGEIYNYKQLCNEFKLCDETIFSDTDVLFKLIEVLGFRAAIKKLRGMFAIVYYDLKNMKIYTARDHFGQKPLWIYRNNGVIAFSSTIKALIKYFDIDINFSKLMYHISKQGKVCSSQTIFNSVSGLRAGEIKEYDSLLNEKSIIYFNHENIIDKKLYKENLKYPIERLDSSIRETISKHCETNSKTGVLLSGGYDSSMILKYSRDFDSTRICLTKLCPGIENIPLKVIPKLLNKYPSDILFKVITPNIYLRELIKFIKTNSSIPKWGGTPAMRYLLNDLKFKNIKVVLGGDGIDESFMGYSSHLNFLKDNGNNKLHSSLNGEILLSDFCKEDNEELIKKRKLIEKNLQEYMSKGEAYTQSFLFQDTFDFRQRCNLPSADLFSMNESVELRNPFVDIEFFKFALNLPLEWKYNNEIGGKYIFKVHAKECIGDIFPKHKEGTRNFSRLLSQTSIWNLDKFRVLDLFPILKSFENFKESTRFTIICVEFLLRILDEPNLEDHKLNILLNDQGKSIFCSTK